MKITKPFKGTVFWKSFFFLRKTSLGIWLYVPCHSKTLFWSFPCPNPFAILPFHGEGPSLFPCTLQLPGCQGAFWLHGFPVPALHCPIAALPPPNWLTTRHFHWSTLKTFPPTSTGLRFPLQCATAVPWLSVATSWSPRLIRCGFKVI